MLAANRRWSRERHGAVVLDSRAAACPHRKEHDAQVKKLLMVVLLTTSLRADDIKPFTAQDYRRFTPDVQASFAGGYLLGYVQSAETVRRTIESALIANGFKIVANEVDTKQQLGCPYRLLRTINFGQAYAILDKYIADHPERWDKQMAVLTEEAFIEACEKRAKNP
jgi:hypothetical protein